MRKLRQTDPTVRVPMRAKKQFLIGLLACACAAGVPADSGDRPAPLPAQAAKNQQGLTHFQQGYYVHMPTGRKAEAQKQLEQAGEAFRQAIEIDGDCIDAHRNLARLYYLERKFDQASTEYAHVIRLNPTDIDTYMHMALAQIELGNVSEAVRYLEAAKKQTDDERVVQQLDGYIAKARQAGMAQ